MDSRLVMKNINFCLVIFFLLFQVNTVSSVQINSIDINESFVIESHDYVTFNLTNAKDSYYLLNYTATASIQFLTVNESNFFRFKNKESFADVRSWSLVFWFNETYPHQFPFANLSYPIRINYIGEIIILLYNVNNFQVSGFFSLKRLIFESDIQNNTITKTITMIQNNTVIITGMKTIKVNVPLEPVEKNDTRTNGFIFSTIVLVFSLIIIIRRNKR